ncbi:RNB domain-containing ribonuclease [Patulibacter sp. SYSU D01012]|uniref:ribonuclease R family protein n=1 Tax=Patulibacter sp. SYSU D01012 TaxID=2817381 RepID=UPI001FF035D8|nr:RNB domain-containing ribonuclease [Patulibacter sp. SYSU D01012]
MAGKGGKRKGPKGRAKGRGPGPSSKRPKEARARGERRAGAAAGGRPAGPNRAARRAANRREERAAPAGRGPRGAGSVELTRNGQPVLPRDVWRDEGPGAPVVGVLRRRGKHWIAEPLFERGRRVTVERGARETGEGRIALLVPDARGRRARGHKVLRAVGRPDVARDVLEALLLDRGLPRRVQRSVGLEAEAVASAPVGEDERERRDLRELPTFTIDPVTARDFDDAISAEAIDGDPEHCRVWVHIADVAAYVRPGGAVDEDARWRGTSVYVPGTVEPMLPRALSNDACSLVPGVDRLAVTVEMELRGGRVLRASVARSLIHSDARLTYDQVDRIFAREERAEDPWATPLDVARRVARALQDRRERTTNALELDTGEPQFRFDDDGHVDGIAIERQTEAHRLIEHLMVGANEQVAKLLADAGVPALHRVHGLPQVSSVQRLADQLASVGVTSPGLDDGASPEDAAALVAELSRRVDAHVRATGHGRAGLSYLVLRALQQARYEPKPLGHAGLGLEHYCHFTSPIRRYPDLVAHRAILSLVGGGEDAPAGSGSRLEELGIWCSATEREAMGIERTADAIARAFLLERTLFAHGWQQRFEGEVTGITAGGAFVRFGGAHLDDEAFEGFLPVRRLGGEDWWDLNELGTVLTASRSGGTLRIGDPLSVAVERVDPARGRVSLLPAADAGRRRGRRADAG